MIHQRTKDVYFLAVRLASRPLGLARRMRYLLDRKRLRIHLGCGHNYLQGFVNADGNLGVRRDVWLDLRNPLPFPTASASLVYSSHALEHLYPDEALSLLREIHRILVAGGVARIAVPSMEHAFEIAAGRAASVFPREFSDPLGQAANWLFCDGQHKYAYSFGSLKEFAIAAGFRSVANVSPFAGFPASRHYEGYELGAEPEGSLVVELTR